MNDAPALVHATVRDGRIVSVSVAPEERAWSDSMTLVDELGKVLSATEVEAWIAEGKDPITTNHAGGPVRVERFLTQCAERQLVGLSANVPGGQLTIRVSGTIVTPRRVDHEGYADLARGSVRAPPRRHARRGAHEVSARGSQSRFDVGPVLLERIWSRPPVARRGHHRRQLAGGDVLARGLTVHAGLHGGIADPSVFANCR